MKNLQIGIIALFAATLGFSQADNTKMNKRDGTGKEMTAERQMENKSDLEITRKIRKSLIDDKSLSTYAKNVKVISRNGKVTLKGPVNSEEEKLKIDGLAKAAAGAENVTNEIEIVKKS
jgi:osmotically-inducible protein OsmY